MYTYYNWFGHCMLTEGYSKDDETMMMAKINFSGTQVGQHPNVINFLGAVIEDTGGIHMPLTYCTVNM